MSSPDLLRGQSKTQSRISQVQPVHHLIVIIAGGGKRIPRESLRIGPFEIDDTPILFIEEVILNWIIKAVLLVRHDLSRPLPGTCRLRRFTVENFAEHR